ncbi:hypothetical protein J2S55_006663 [Streptosporangium brasiliense]|uniref:Uncharacterized protein n=1 Tax=Streptosporangium brasiliense TaxID=47480 RepID=A0ABT9REY9_9ACTN|nr:hypothetical protein [Streptosporangium brasiliense]
MSETGEGAVEAAGRLRPRPGPADGLTAGSARITGAAERAGTHAEKSTT